jgi:membrane glycosyltransferase
VAFAVTLFMFGLLFGRRVGWDAQQRSRERLCWDEAARALWPQTVAGLALVAWLWVQAPWALAFGAPVLASLALAIPFAVASTWPPLGLWSRRAGLFDIPEDRAAPPETAGTAPATNVA